MSSTGDRSARSSGRSRSRLPRVAALVLATPLSLGVGGCAFCNASDLRAERHPVGALGSGLGRPLVTLDAEYLRLLARRREHVDAHRVTRERLDARRRRRAIHRGAERGCGAGVVLRLHVERSGGVVEPDVTPDRRRVRHPVVADALVLVLEEERNVAVRDAVLREDIHSPPRAAVGRARGSDDDRAVEPDSRVLEHVPPVPHERHRLPHLGSRVVRERPVLTWGHRLRRLVAGGNTA